MKRKRTPLGLWLQRQQREFFFGLGKAFGETLLQYLQEREKSVPKKQITSGRGFTILSDKQGKKISITCNNCGLTSYNPNDIKNKFCGNCHRYH